ncbi:hypothetical protein [Azorhizophilus paspali]|uniref:Uncharacterized protein n=1 Tax=Azorhizophilus paspali TaxID=69963 RepID=A0ABV6SS88_AZOPA
MGIKNRLKPSTWHPTGENGHARYFHQNHSIDRIDYKSVQGDNGFRMDYLYFDSDIDPILQKPDPGGEE